MKKNEATAVIRYALDTMETMYFDRSVVIGDMPNNIMRVTFEADYMFAIRDKNGTLEDYDQKRVYLIVDFDRHGWVEFFITEDVSEAFSHKSFEEDRDNHEYYDNEVRGRGSRYYYFDDVINCAYFRYVETLLETADHYHFTPLKMRIMKFPEKEG